MPEKEHGAGGDLVESGYRDDSGVTVTKVLELVPRALR